jgi:hypothetical protein
MLLQNNGKPIGVECDLIVDKKKKRSGVDVFSAREARSGEGELKIMASMNKVSSMPSLRQLLGKSFG